jgi:ATP-binding cassette, subfamily B, bacterial
MSSTDPNGQDNGPADSEEVTPQGGPASWQAPLAPLVSHVEEAMRVLAGTPRVLRLVWEAHPGYAAALIGLNVAPGLEPLAQAWITKLIVDAVAGSVQPAIGVGTSAATPGPNIAGLSDAASVIAPYVVVLVILKAAVNLASGAIEPAVRLIRLQLADYLTRDINNRILRKANSLVDISFFESPRFYDFLQRAENESSYRPLGMLDQLTGFLRSSISLLSMVIVVIALSPLLALAVIALALPHLILQFRQQRENWSLTNFQLSEVRQMRYFSSLLTSNGPAKEIRLFGLGDYLVGQYLAKFDVFHRRQRTVRFSQWRSNTLLAALSALGSAGAYGYVALTALEGRITLGDLALYTGAIYMVQSSLSYMIWAVASLYEGNLFADHLFQFLSMAPTMRPLSPEAARPVPVPLRDGIEFRQVAFRYPDSDRFVLEDVSFTIAPGRAVALVGENGAGKTTLVKLLARLFDPTRGQILVDGVDLREYDLESWRKQIGVIFQDFCHYHMSAGENIGVGDVERVGDRAAIRAAAEQGGAVALLDRLPNGYDTQLGRWLAGHDDGAELSGGEWQAIGLSRAFMRSRDANGERRLGIGQPGDSWGGAPFASNGSSSMPHSADLDPQLPSAGAQLLILDEPTAALDARAEYGVYQRFHELTRGKATLLISHRFSTVKMADVIVVLEGGRIVEHGNHDQLVARGGTYARLYSMQAERYQ